MHTNLKIRRLLITPGEPAGIGPDITIRALNNDFNAEVVVISDPDLLRERAALLNLELDLNILDSIDHIDHTHDAGTIDVYPVKLNAVSRPGILSEANSEYVLKCLTIAAEYCMLNKHCALITGPVHKGIINKAGFAFTGHTEFLSTLARSKPVMMLATPTLRVALVTTHLPLKLVSEHITPENVEYAVITAHHFLKHNCNIEKPTILVCGLNPHAGEDGYMGREEIDTINPTLEKCRQENINVIGPLPADTIFTSKYLESADLVLAMYHDQGLPVLKHTGFGNAVNVTLGLPFIRTSVDHGTALELAGSGLAKEDSLLAAIEMASQLNLT